MNLETAHPGYPFEGDYRLYGQPDAYSQEVVGGPTRDLEQRRADLDRRREILERINAMREAAGYRRFAYICRDDGADVLFDPEEIVTSTSAFTDREVSRGLRDRGFEPPDEAGRRLPDQVMRLRRTGRRADEDTSLENQTVPTDLRGAITWLRAQGRPASLNYLMAQAPTAVGKAAADPLPVTGNLPAPFAQYAAGFPPATHPPLTVAVIDGGKAGLTRADGWLGNVPLTSANIDPIDVAPADGHRDEMAGHGERVLGVVQQVAPHCNLRMYRVADTTGLAYDQDIATAIQQAVQDGARVLNISLAGAIVPNMPPLSTAVAIAQVRQQYGDGVSIVAAAGNFGNAAPTFPAASDPYVVSVAGLTAQLMPSTWSTRGWVTFSTVAENILSTFVEEVYPPVGTLPEPWARTTGTSFAAPQIAGAIARICYMTGLTPGAAVAELQRVGVPTPDFGVAVQILPGL